MQRESKTAGRECAEFVIFDLSVVDHVHKFDTNE
jgi:hypothetical protein